jgi:hypothetical protein
MGTASTGRPRRILAGVALVLACLMILVTTVAVWTHQVALNTDRFTSLASHVTSDPALIDPLSARISDQVVTALDVQGRLETRLPDAIKPLAGTLTLAVTGAIDTRLQTALLNPRIQAALLKTLSFTHAGIVNLLRDKPDAVTVVDGYITLQVFPIVGAALAELQSSGILPADIQLPDLSGPDAPGVMAQRLDSALGITLPADFGLIKLVKADRLQTARTYVQYFDAIVVALVILSVLLVLLALWLARDRRRMLVYLGIGTVIAFLVARLAINGIENAVLAGIADDDLAGAVRAVADATVEDLRGLTIVIAIAAGIVAIVAYLAGRPAWLFGRGDRPDTGSVGPSATTE